MKNHSKPIIIVLIIILLIGGAYLAYNELTKNTNTNQLADTDNSTTETPSTPETQQKKNTAPDFTVYDSEGNPFRLSDFVGKPTVLNFWASWCGPCKMEMPDFEEKYLELGDEINFLMVNATDGSRETVEIASEFIKEQGYTFPVYYDATSEASITYSVYSLPTTYFINKDGVIITRASGAIDGATLQKGIDMIKGD